MEHDYLRHNKILKKMELIYDLKFCHNMIIIKNCAYNSNYSFTDVHTLKRIYSNM